MKRILFTGGGSAGHVVPNLAVMQRLRYACDLLYMGGGGIEKKLVTEAGYPFFRVDCPKLVRAFTAENLKIPYRLFRARREALAILKRERPDLVFSKGGYVSYPAVWAASRLGIPILTHESDLTPGLCTKLIAKKCRLVLTSFPETAARFPNGKFVGSPLRRELFAGDRRLACKRLELPENAPVLLVFGGGSGSLALDEAVSDNLEELLETFSVLHISSRRPQTRLEKNGHVYLCVPYIADMGGAYAAADVVLCRAGSNTVFELSALGKRAVLVPLCHASRGDQAENARYFEARGLADVLPEAELGSLCKVLKTALAKEAPPPDPAWNGTDAIVSCILDRQEGARP